MRVLANVCACAWWAWLPGISEPAGCFVSSYLRQWLAPRWRQFGAAPSASPARPPAFPSPRAPRRLRKSTSFTYDRQQQQRLWHTLEQQTGATWPGLPELPLGEEEEEGVAAPQAAVGQAAA